MPEHAELSDAELDDCEPYFGMMLRIWDDRFLDEIRRVRDAEHQKLRALVDDVIAHPERHPEIVAEARRRMGR